MRRLRPCSDLKRITTVANLCGLDTNTANCCKAGRQTKTAHSLEQEFIDTLYTSKITYHYYLKLDLFQNDCLWQ